MTVAGFYDDENFRNVIQNTAAVEAVQKMVQQHVGSAVDAVRQAIGVNSISKQILDAFPSIPQTVAESMKMSVQATLPTIELPKMPITDFNALAKVKLGDDVERQFVASLDYASITKGVAKEGDLPDPENDVVVDADQFTEEQLDQMVVDVFARHPDLADQFYNNPALTDLDPVQKKMMSWSLALFGMFALVLAVAWGTQEERVEQVLDTASLSIPLGYSIYKGGKKIFDAEGKKQDGGEDEPEDKKEGS